MTTNLIVKQSNNKKMPIPMNKLKNGEFAIVTDDTYPEYNGHLVVRTLSACRFEVMDLSKFEPDSCWVLPIVTLAVTVVDAVVIQVL